MNLAALVASLSKIEVSATRDAYPLPDGAPRTLWRLKANCGPMVAWSVLTYFGMSASCRRIMHACRYSKQNGVFPICMALGLAELGLVVRFHTNPDPDIKSEERSCISRAIAIGLQIASAVSLRSIVSLFPASVPVVFYNERGDEGHFSPLLGRIGSTLVLPFANTVPISARAFSRMWNANGICRQCLIVSRGTR